MVKSLSDRTGGIRAALSRVRPSGPATPSPRPIPNHPHFGEFGEGRGKGQALARLTMNAEGGKILHFGESLGSVWGWEIAGSGGASDCKSVAISVVYYDIISK